jgi:hypothetical protein
MDKIVELFSGWSLPTPILQGAAQLLPKADSKPSCQLCS